jgi:hypothetical protein
MQTRLINFMSYNMINFEWFSIKNKIWSLSCQPMQTRLINFMSCNMINFKWFSIKNKIWSLSCQPMQMRLINFISYNMINSWWFPLKKKYGRYLANQCKQDLLISSCTNLSSFPLKRKHSSSYVGFLLNYE